MTAIDGLESSSFADIKGADITGDTVTEFESVEVDNTLTVTGATTTYGITNTNGLSTDTLTIAALKRPSILRTLTTAQSIPNASQNGINYNTTITGLSTGTFPLTVHSSYFSNDTSSNITAFVSFYCGYVSNSTGWRSASITTHDGTNGTVNWASACIPAYAGGDITQISVSSIVTILPSGYLQPVTYQTSGAALNTSTTFGQPTVQVTIL